MLYLCYDIKSNSYITTNEYNMGTQILTSYPNSDNTGFLSLLQETERIRTKERTLPNIVFFLTVKGVYSI
jgi:hypothetical protein